MKAFIAAFLCLLSGVLPFGCAKKPPSEPGTTGAPSVGAVTFYNGVREADVWLLPETEEIKKTTLWGEATLPRLGAGASREAALPAPGPSGLYALRVIDTEGMYYAADGLRLASGDVLMLSEEKTRTVLTVTRANGAPEEQYAVFAAKL